MASLYYDGARKLLEETFAVAEGDLLRGAPPAINKPIASQCQVLFRTSVQAYREVLLGCLIARMQDKSIDIRQPYVGQGPKAFNGRTLDERAVNPFLHDKHIPSSRGPYLSVFRRSVLFDESTRSGLRDKAGYDALLGVLSYVEATSSRKALKSLLHYLLFKFAELREAAHVPVSRLRRISLEQCGILISGLLAVASGGRFPVMLVLATFSAVREFFGLNWEIESQGINVPDEASGAGGDVTIRADDKIVLAAEVTERPVDRSRVVATFNTKIAPTAIEDYLFLVKHANQDAGALEQARQYFSQGHDVNFIEIQKWIVMTLATLGRKGRETFIGDLARRMDAEDVPKSVKMAWNDVIATITSVPRA
jgi:hypothetical protein